MKIRFCVLLLLLWAASTGCGDNRGEGKETILASMDGQLTYAADSTLNLISMYCYSCHNPASDSHESIIAPPLAAVKIRYRRVYSDRHVFIDSMTSFLRKPSGAKAKMPGAVTRCGHKILARFFIRKSYRNLAGQELLFNPEEV